MHPTRPYHWQAFGTQTEQFVDFDKVAETSDNLLLALRTIADMRANWVKESKKKESHQFYKEFLGFYQDVRSLKEKEENGIQRLLNPHTTVISEFENLVDEEKEEQKNHTEDAILQILESDLNKNLINQSESQYQ